MISKSLPRAAGLLAVLFLCGLAHADVAKEAASEGPGKLAPEAAAPAASASPAPPSADPMREWVLKAMVAWSPPGRSLIKDAKETADEGRARYAEIADAMLRVIYDPSEPSAYSGSKGRGRTLALMLSVAWHESGFRKDVDLGVGKLARGDNGKSWCLIQAQLGAPGKDGKTPGVVVLDDSSFIWTTRAAVAKSPPPAGHLALGGEDLVADRQLCIRTGLRMARKSLRSCRSLPVLERLAGLSGSCDRGRKESRSRMAKAVEWVSRNPLPMDDADVISALFPTPTPSPTPSPAPAPVGASAGPVAVVGQP